MKLLLATGRTRRANGGIDNANTGNKMNVAEEDIKRYIEDVHSQPWHLLSNNCFHKSIKIFRAAKELGVKAELILCLARSPWWKGINICPHMFVIVNGQKVDVGLSPEQEKKYYRNEERKTYFPVKIASHFEHPKNY